jgi:hypothetical protein
MQWVPEVLFARIKRQERETHHSTASSTKVKNGGAIFPLVCLDGIVLYYIIKYKYYFIILWPAKDATWNLFWYI